jgi:hypothetical protein
MLVCIFCLLIIDFYVNSTLYIFTANDLLTGFHLLRHQHIQIVSSISQQLYFPYVRYITLIVSNRIRYSYLNSFNQPAVYFLSFSFSSLSLVEWKQEEGLGGYKLLE